DQRATTSVPRNYGKHTTLVAALAPDGLQVPWLMEGARDTATFAWSIAEQLAPPRRPGQIVVLETLSVHTAARSRHALEARHCPRLFLSPSSPDCTPIAPRVHRRFRRSQPSCARSVLAPRRPSGRPCGWRSRPSRPRMRWPSSLTLATLCLLH